jgi:hypothetical protein
LNDLETSLIVESLVELAAEMVDMHRDSVGCDRGPDQPGGSEIIKTKSDFTTACSFARLACGMSL